MDTVSHSRKANGARRGVRGQAVVEFMMFMIVFVPIMLYSLYITDALFDWLKAQEAVGAAAWEYTGELLHDYSGFNHSSKYSAATSNVPKVKTRYQGLDGWNSAAPTKRITPATSGELLSLDCKPSTTVQEPLESTAVKNAALPKGLDRHLHTGGMILCQSSVSIANVYFGGKPIENYMSGGGNHWWGSGSGDVALFSKRMLQPMTLCGVGSPSGGSCPNSQGFSVLTDDWGLAEDQETSNNNDQNTNYPDHSKTNAHFDALGTEAYKDLTIAAAGPNTPENPVWVPIDNKVDEMGVGGPDSLSPPVLDTKYMMWLLSYEAEDKNGPDDTSAGPVLRESSLSSTEGGNQPSETFPEHHGKISPQQVDNATYAADHGDPRTNDYLAL